MTDFHLTQVNIARPVLPLTEPELAWFVDALAPVNAAADAAPGFVWRMQAPQAGVVRPARGGPPGAVVGTGRALPGLTMIARGVT